MPVRIVFATLALSAATGLAFAMWIDNGARILFSLAETGLAWCF